MADRQTHHLSRIHSDPSILSGRPVIRGTRVMVSSIRRFIEDGYTVEQIMAEYPGVTVEDVEAVRGATH